MATTDEINDADDNVRLALLLGIKDAIPQVIKNPGPYSLAIVRMAEAYAWVSAPRQPHGGSSGEAK